MLLFYLEQIHDTHQVRDLPTLKQSLHSPKGEDECIYTASLVFYTLLLFLRIILVLVAVYEASEAQSKRMKPNFWIVFASFLFPEAYLAIHLINATAKPQPPSSIPISIGT